MEHASVVENLPEIADEYMRESLTRTRSYTLAILKKGPAYDPPRSDAIIWEHGRRNFSLRAARLLTIVCPIRDTSELAGMSIFESRDAKKDGPASSITTFAPAFVST